MGERGVTRAADAPKPMLLTNTINKMLAGAPLASPVFAQRFMAAAMTIMTGRTDLSHTTKESRLVALLHCARLGLVPHPILQHVHIVPFKRSLKGPDGKWSEIYEATVIVGYKGRIELARRDANFHSCWASEVYANDLFDWNKGDGSFPRHVPWNARGESEPGELLGFYACAKDKDGGAYPAEFMSVAEVNQIKTRSRSGEKGPWHTDYNMMARKTVIHRASKVWPCSVEMEYAGALDNAADTGESQRKIVRNTAIGDSELDPDLDAMLGEDPAPPPADEEPQTEAAAEAGSGAPPEAAAPPARVSLPELIEWYSATKNVTADAATKAIDKLCIATNKRPASVFAADPNRFVPWARKVMGGEIPTED